MNRAAKLRPALPPLTPDIPAPAPSGVITRDEAIKEIATLKAFLAGERRRHGKMEAALMKYLDGIELQLANFRSAYFTNLIMYPSQPEGKR
jgi:hypothetical protein